jgi:acetylglutamate kinase
MTVVNTSVDPATRADILAEAIPFIRRFAGRPIVIKYGGNALGNGSETDALASFAQDIVLLRSVGILPVVVHGGGPQIGSLMERLGKVPEFRDGLRVTDAETLDIARMVLVGKVNRDIVGAINVHGPLAVGLSGEDAGFITAEARNPSLGFVGDVVSVDPTLIVNLIAQGLVPVIATIGSDAAGQAYNINADTVAGAIAESIDCEKLIFLTDIVGILRDRDNLSSLVNRCDADQLDAMIAEGLIGEGMIPKAHACASAVRHGVRSAHILDGRIAHAALLELLTEQGVGTMVTQSQVTQPRVTQS